MRLLWIWVTKKCVLDGCCVRLCPKWWDQAWKHVNHYLPATKMRIMICCTAPFQVMRDECIITTQKWQASHINTVTPVLSERKNSDSTFRCKMHAHRFLGLKRHHLQEYMVKGMKTNPETYVKTLRGLKQLINHICHRKKKAKASSIL
jgi:hypothetical protein